MGRQLEMECSAITYHVADCCTTIRLMYELDLSPTSTNTLHSHLTLTVRDVETERDTKLDRLNNAMSVRDIKQLYAQKEKRVNIDSTQRLTYTHANTMTPTHSTADHYRPAQHRVSH